MIRWRRSGRGVPGRGGVILLVALLAFGLGLVAGKGSYPFRSCTAQEGDRNATDGAVPIRGPFYIARDGYVVCYDGRLRNPIWVYEYLTPDLLVGDAKRKNCFRRDPRIPYHLQASLVDFEKSGFDRGHMAAAANHTDQQQHMDETFYLSNLCPQTGAGFNRSGGAWNRLEMLIRELVSEGTPLHVVSGPLYLATDTGNGKRLLQIPVIGGRDVAVPTHFFKLIVPSSAEETKRLAFIIPNEAIHKDVRLSDFAVSPHALECCAGFQWLN